MTYWKGERQDMTVDFVLLWPGAETAFFFIFFSGWICERRHRLLDIQMHAALGGCVKGSTDATLGHSANSTRLYSSA